MYLKEYRVPGYLIRRLYVSARWVAIETERYLMIDESGVATSGVRHFDTREEAEEAAALHCLLRKTEC